MGMDVYGKNPKQNKLLSEFPVYHKFKDMDFKDKWKELDKDEEQPWTIGTDALQFYLVGALKEAISKIETLEAKVKALEEA